MIRSRALAARLTRACVEAAVALSIAGCRGANSVVPGSESAAPGEVAPVSREIAGDSANALTDRGLSAEALPYIRRIEELEPQQEPAFDAALGAVCNDAALESRVVRAVPLPAVRSTVERVALGREGLARVGRALRRSAAAADSSKFLAIRAQSLAMWGFSREAVVTWRTADRCQRLTGRTRQQASMVEGWLLDPLPEHASVGRAGASR